MAALTLLLDNFGNLAGIGHVADLRQLGPFDFLVGGDQFRGRRADAFNRLVEGPLHLGTRDRTTLNGRGGCLDLAALKQRVDRLDEIGLLGVLPAQPVMILVIDRASVTQVSTAIEQECLAGPGRHDQVGDLVPLVVKDREVDAELAGVFRNRLRRGVGIGIDPEEDDALGLEPVGQRLQAGHVLVADRAIRPEEDQDGPFFASEVVKSHGLAGCGILEAKVRNRLADAAIQSKLVVRTSRACERHPDEDAAYQQNAHVAASHPQSSWSKVEALRVRSVTSRLGIVTLPKHERFRNNVGKW